MSVFHKLMPMLWVAMVIHAQSTKNKSFAITLQYLKKKGRDEVDFLHTGKHQTFLKVISIS